jgi:type IV secretory system conjugative DNA transfer VirD4/TraG family protein
VGVLAASRKLAFSLLVAFYRAARFFLSRPDKLHNARFARIDELTILLGNILDRRVALLLGISRFDRVLRVRSSQKRRELGNLLVVAPTRGGKGLLAVSQLLAWPHSVIVNDIKGDLFAQTAGDRRKRGNVRVFDTTGVGHRFDPLNGRLTKTSSCPRQRVCSSSPTRATARSSPSAPPSCSPSCFLPPASKAYRPFFTYGSRSAPALRKPPADSTRSPRSLPPSSRRRVCRGEFQRSLSSLGLGNAQRPDAPALDRNCRALAHQLRLYRKRDHAGEHPHHHLPSLAGAGPPCPLTPGAPAVGLPHTS